MNRPKQVVILGTGGNSVDILDTINDINDRASTPLYECLGFLDDNASLWGKDIHGAAVLGPLEKAHALQQRLEDQRAIRLIQSNPTCTVHR